MKFQLRHLVAAAAVAVASAGATAAPLDLGTNPTYEPVTGFGSAADLGTVTFSYAFTLDATTDFSDLFVSLRPTDPVDFTLTLTGPTGSALTGSATYAAKKEFTFSSLADGAYVLSIVGTPTSSTFASYGGFVNVTPAVPEPESIALALAGLGVAFTLGRRRKS